MLIFGVPLYGEIHASQWSLENIQPLSPVWTNSTWRRFTGNRQSLLQCLTPSSARRLSLWLTGQTDAASFVSPSVSPSVSVRSGDSSVRSPDEQQHADTTSPTLTLEFKFGASKLVKLTLAKTVQPVYRLGADGARKIVRTHEAAIVTTMPSGQVRLELPSARRRSFGTAAYDPIPEDDVHAPPSSAEADKAPPLTSKSSDSPASVVSYPSSAADHRAPPSFMGTANGRVAPSSVMPRLSRSSSYTSGPTTDELDGWSATRAASSSRSAPISLPGWQPGQTIELQPDGSAKAVTYVFGYGPKEDDEDDGDHDDKPPDAQSKDVATLLKTTKWANTPLGKRKHWPASLEMLREFGLSGWH